MYKIEEIEIFKSLSSDALKKLKDKMFIKEYKKDAIVFFEGDKSDFLYLLLEGEVKLYKTTQKNNQIHISYLPAPSLIGEYATFDQCAFPATCQFTKDGVMGKIPSDFFINELLTQKEVAYYLIRSLTAKVALLSSLLHKETVLSSEAKVADILLNKSELFNRLKNSEIAEILNLTPETLSRILSKFKKEKIIELKKHKLTILDTKSLEIIVETNKFKACAHCIMNKNKTH
jgi:CRP/FNR family transcriptional regulator